jgi:hypothetical protein
VAAQGTAVQSNVGDKVCRGAGTLRIRAMMVWRSTAGPVPSACASCSRRTSRATVSRTPSASDCGLLSLLLDDCRQVGSGLRVRLHPSGNQLCAPTWATRLTCGHCFLGPGLFSCICWGGSVTMHERRVV